MIGQEIVRLRDPLYSSVCYSGHNRLEATVAFDSGERPKPDTLHLWRKTRTSNPLVGTWKLVSWENRSLDGQVSYPLGEDAVGYISYSQDGYVFVAMMRSERTQFTAGDLLRASAEEKVHAAETYVTYCGRYELRGDTVVHHVELSLFPNWVGVDQERLVEIAGNRLTVSTRPMLLGGIQRSGHLIWERVRTS